VGEGLLDAVAPHQAAIADQDELDMAKEILIGDDAADQPNNLPQRWGTGGFAVARKGNIPNRSLVRREFMAIEEITAGGVFEQ